MGQRDALPGEINGDAVDRFTLAHAAWGVALGLMGVSLPVTIALAIGWELIEDRLKDEHPEVFPNATHDSPANATCDALAVVLGRVLVRAL